MPYRRLPTTDAARIRALKTALELAENREKNQLAFSKNILHELRTVKTSFESGMIQYEHDVKMQLEKMPEYKVAMEKARIYVQHYVQILLMAIERDEIQEDILTFYGFNNPGDKLPNLTDEETLLKFGNRIIEADLKRIQNGGSPLYNPSIALVKIKLEEFKDAAIYQANLKRNVNRSFDKMKGLRKSTNDFISKLWTEIEENLQADSEKHKRQLAQEYGLVYVFRRKERRKLKSEDLQRDLIFDFG